MPSPKSVEEGWGPAGNRASPQVTRLLDTLLSRLLHRSIPQGRALSQASGLEKTCALPLLKLKREIWD
jgi:hypothetical protein